MFFLGDSDNISGKELVVIHLFGFFLRDLPVLAVETSEITAGGGYRKYQGGRIEMVQGFFLNGVSMNGTGISIGKGVKLSSYIYL